eukprot:2047589-Amphidinium_carterae.1
MSTPDFNNAATKVEDFYRNVYIDNNYASGVHALKGKYYKGKSTSEKGKGDYNAQKTNVVT